MESANTIYNYFTTNTFNAKSEKVFADDIRLNAEYYVEENSLVLDTAVEFVSLSTLASVVFPGIFKRYLVDDIKFGIRFLTTSDMMMLEPETDKILSTDLTTNLDIYKVSENTLLVSRSGTIGNTIYVDDRIKNFALTEDALRVKPYDNKKIGLLYFYFNSEFGRNSITGKKSGAVIDHIYEDDLLRLPVPKFNDQLIESLFDSYLKVKKNRENAHQFIVKARSLTIKYNNLPDLKDCQVVTLDPEKQTQARLTNLSEFSEGFRFDAHFYNPVAKLASDHIKEKSARYEKLRYLTNDIVIGKRFKRNYVESDHGTPFIGSKNIIQIRPTELKFLSNSEIGFMEDLILKKGMILIACSGSLGGTFGRTSYVHKNFENYAASQHILRIIPDENLIDSGYLYAFLSSDYGYECITRYRWGALIDEIDDKDMAQLEIPLTTDHQQREIGDLVRKAYELRADAIFLEDEATKLITKTLTQK